MKKHRIISNTGQDLGELFLEVTGGKDLVVAFTKMRGFRAECFLSTLTDGEIS
jgi:hypothetical protein